MEEEIPLWVYSKKKMKVLTLFSFSSQKNIGYQGWNSQNTWQKSPTAKILIRLLLQKQSDLGLLCLSRILWQATTVRNFRTFTVLPFLYTLLQVVGDTVNRVWEVFKSNSESLLYNALILALVHCFVFICLVCIICLICTVQKKCLNWRVFGDDYEINQQKKITWKSIPQSTNHNCSRCQFLRHLS